MVAAGFMFTESLLEHHGTAFLQQPIFIKMKQETIQETKTSEAFTIKIENEDYLVKIERAKKLLALYNDITFGDDISAVKSRLVLQKLA